MRRLAACFCEAQIQFNGCTARLSFPMICLIMRVVLRIRNALIVFQLLLQLTVAFRCNILSAPRIHRFRACPSRSLLHPGTKKKEESTATEGIDIFVEEIFPYRHDRPYHVDHFRLCSVLRMRSRFVQPRTGNISLRARALPQARSRAGKKDQQGTPP